MLRVAASRSSVDPVHAKIVGVAQPATGLLVLRRNLTHPQDAFLVQSRLLPLEGLLYLLALRYVPGMRFVAVSLEGRTNCVFRTNVTVDSGRT